MPYNHAFASPSGIKKIVRPLESPVMRFSDRGRLILALLIS